MLNHHYYLLERGKEKPILPRTAISAVADAGERPGTAGDWMAVQCSSELMDRVTAYRSSSHPLHHRNRPKSGARPLFLDSEIISKRFQGKHLYCQTQSQLEFVSAIPLCRLQHKHDSSGRLQDWDLATGLWGLKVRGKSGESLLKLHQAAGRESVQKKQLGHIGSAIRDLVGKKKR